MKTSDVSDNLLSSAKVVENNIDLLSIILVRVPAKSLVRFKCVSKHWLSLISDSKFSNNHTCKNFNLSLSGLYIDSVPVVNFKSKSPNVRKSLPTLEFITTSLGKEVTILHSCNGLMLCSYDKELIVCNFTTQKFKVISPPSPSPCTVQRDGFLAFYPTISSIYMVVLIHIGSYSIVRNEFMLAFDIDIYSSDSENWKRIRIDRAYSVFHFLPKVLCNRSIYWINDENENLLRIDLYEEKLTSMKMPSEPVICGIANVLWFGENDGRLSLIQNRSPIKTDLQFLEMDMQNFRWTVMYNVNLGPVLRHDCKEFEEVLCFCGGDEENYPHLVLVISGKIVSYNPNGNFLDIFHEIPNDPNFKRMFLHRFTHKFVESLASI